MTHPLLDGKAADRIDEIATELDRYYTRKSGGLAPIQEQVYLRAVVAYLNEQAAQEPAPAIERWYCCACKSEVSGPGANCLVCKNSHNLDIHIRRNKIAQELEDIEHQADRSTGSPLFLHLVHVVQMILKEVGKDPGKPDV